MSPQRYAKLIRHLVEGEYNCRELAELVGVHYITVLDYTRALHDEKVIHVARWERDGLGRDAVKVYKFGDAPDAERRRISRTEAQRRYRARKNAVTLAAAGIDLTED